MCSEYLLASAFLVDFFIHLVFFLQELISVKIIFSSYAVIALFFHRLIL